MTRTANAGAALPMAVCAALLAATPAVAQNAGYIFCSAWGDGGRHYYSAVFAGSCEPTVTRTGGQIVRLEHMCREGGFPAAQFAAYLRQAHGLKADDHAECFKDGEAQARKFFEAEQRRDRDGGDEPVLTDWKPG